MSLPGVTINLLNNQLGTVTPTADGVSGLIMSGVATGNISLLEAKQIFSLAEAVALGLDEDYDTTNSMQVYRQIREFYEEAGNGTELWIMLVSDTTTMEDMADAEGAIAPALLNAAAGKIRLLGVSRTPDGGYTPTYDNELDDDVIDAVAKAQALAEAFAALFKPVRVLIEGRDFQGTLADLPDLRQRTDNRVGVVIGTSQADTTASVGMALGRAAGNPVQRKISRVKDGAVTAQAAYLSDGNPIEDLSAGQQDSLHDKGYIFLRGYANKTGYFFSSDPVCAPLTDDYSSLARGRVIDKAIVIAYTTFVDELEDDLPVDQNTGYLPPSVVKSYQGKIENAVNALMTAEDEISGVRCVIDPKQNLLQNSTLNILLKVTPKGYSSAIDVELGFDNPLNN